VLPGIVSGACPAPADPTQTAADDDRGSIVGESAPIQQLRATIRKSAASTATVLIEGETGTGKELVARAIHRTSDRARGPFVAFDARVIAASNQDLERLVQHRRFRADLFFRLDVLRIRVPALRERREDVPLLFEHSIARFNLANGTRFGAISPQSMAALVRRPWPGNVRELENVIERTLVNSSHPTID